LAAHIPELRDLLARLAFSFGTVRRVTASDARRKLAVEINEAPGFEAFAETEFGYLVYNEANE
jgi:hypothetical protein